MAVDPEVANSNGFFKDPGTRQPLTGAEERVVKCELLPNGKLVWPQVRFSDGTQGKIVFKLWTAEEKETYKRYRNVGKSEPVHKAAAEPVLVEPLRVAGAVQAAQPEVTEEWTDSRVLSGELTHPQVDYANSTPSASTLRCIAECDEWLGPWEFDGTLYEQLRKKGDRAINFVPRCLIPEKDRRRLGMEA